MIAILFLAQDLPVKLTGKHYDLRSSAPKEQAQELLDFMEQVHAAYSEIFPAAASKRKTLVLYKDRDEYLKRSGGGGASAACYNGKQLQGYWDPELMNPCFAHEAVHQFVHLSSKMMSSIPEWFHEGLADALADYEIRDGKFVFATGKGTIARMRIAALGRTIPLKDLLTMGEKRFQEGSPFTYAQAWSLCHFLLAKYRKNLFAYYDLLRAGGTTHEKAWAKAFPGKLDELEREWREAEARLK